MPPTLETLRRIQLAHACTIPFENLDILLGRRIDLDPAAVHRKLVTARRGGYCFEQNGLLLRQLAAMGFDAHALPARVRFIAAREDTPPRTHLFAKVILEGVPWLVDVGVGGLTPTAPIRMDETEPQETPHDVRRVVAWPGADARRGSARWLHQVRLGSEWRDVCEFTDDPMPAIDRELANWWTSTHPTSKFRRRISAARAEPDGSRHTLDHLEYTHRLHGVVQAHETIASSDRLLAVLAERFTIQLPAGTAFGLDDV